MKQYSLAIIGAGPAGLTASIYASRYKIDNIVIGEAIGGLIFEAHKVCNFPTDEEITGQELTLRMKKHVEALGASILQTRVSSIEKQDDGFKISVLSGEDILAKAIILAIGTKHRKLGLPEESKFLGRGVSYCATCDGMFYKEKTVAVIGGANSAHTSSLYLADIADKVYQIYRGDKFKGETSWIEQVINNDNIEVIYNNQIIGLLGEDKLEKVILKEEYNGKKEIALDGLFVEIGTIPDLEIIKELNLDVNENGYIKVNKDQSASQTGIWAAGDITDASNSFRQVATAIGEGAVAANSAFKYLQEKVYNKKNA